MLRVSNVNFNFTIFVSFNKYNVRSFMLKEILVATTFAIRTKHMYLMAYLLIRVVNYTDSNF